MKIVITGADGLFGFHLRCFFKALKIEDLVIEPVNRNIFHNHELLSRSLESADAVIHLAGMNRGDDATIFKTNVDLTTKLIDAISKLSVKPHVLFANSTHVERNTAYGKSKKECSTLFKKGSEEGKFKFSDIVFPHLFGEHGKPFYNSVISTFCFQVANGETTEVREDSQIEALHLSESSKIIWKLISEQHSGVHRSRGTLIMVSELLRKIQDFKKTYSSGILPKLSVDFDIQLFNVFKSYLFPKSQPIFMPLKIDNRGTLFEAVKTEGHGQCFLSTTKPGVTRGNHFHVNKLERFCVISGEASIKIRKLFSSDIYEFNVTGEKPCAIDIPTLHTHNITNTGSCDLVTLFWSGDIFDQKNTDTFGELVENLPTENCGSTYSVETNPLSL